MFKIGKYSQCCPSERLIIQNRNVYGNNFGRVWQPDLNRQKSNTTSQVKFQIFSFIQHFYIAIANQGPSQYRATICNAGLFRHTYVLHHKMVVTICGTIRICDGINLSYGSLQDMDLGPSLQNAPVLTQCLRVDFRIKAGNFLKTT